MAKAWKERLEPNLKKYEKEIGYGNLLFSEQFGFLTYYNCYLFIGPGKVPPQKAPIVYPNTAMYFFDTGIM